MNHNKQFIRALFKDCSDCVIREFEIKPNIPALAVFVDGLVNTGWVNEALQSIMVFEGGSKDIQTLSNAALPVSQMQITDNYGDFLISVLGGDTGIIVEGNDQALLLGIRGPKTRSISEPETEAVVRGPREGFIENLRVNTSLLRRKLKTPRLKTKPFTLGTHTNTNIVISYLEGVCDPRIVAEVEGRLQKLKIDGILDSGYIEELIEDSIYSPFPQIQYTERPDIVASALLQGRVAVFVDGTPFVLIVPTVFWHLMQASEDYYERFQMGTLIRFLRYVFLLLALVTPAFYIAITTFHQELIPTSLLLSIAAAREAIPFPAVVEAFIMEITFEALREAGIRLPKAVGQAVSILGALVVGQAAVEAGIVSAPMVIVVAVTGIASFTIPRFNGAIAIRMLRFPLMIAAAIFGMYGILIGIMLILGHMAGLRSFGVPYLSPAGPMSAGDLKDILIRAPWPLLDTRPQYMPVRDGRRMNMDMQKDILAQNGQTGANVSHERERVEKPEGADVNDAPEQ
ncbi:MAG TPA: spore germination protein [Bacilli bacterium]